MHSNWRDCQAWNDEGLKLSTTSNEAAKLFDAALTQYCGLFSVLDDGTNAFDCISHLNKEQPHFVMGRALMAGLDLVCTSRTPRLDPEFQLEIDSLVSITNASPDVTARERKHVAAIDVWSKGRMLDACSLYEDILTEHPTDMLAIKFAHHNYLYAGPALKMRDGIAKVLPSWKKSVPLYSYLMGMYSFGLVETNMCDKAEKVAREGLEMNRRDAWSTHSMAHVFEMMGRSKEGIRFLTSTETDWSFRSMLASHNYWHWAVYCLENGLEEEALAIYDSEINERAQSGAMLDVIDACSFLYRLEMEGVKVGPERWSDIYNICRPHKDDHILLFNDIHFLMTYLGADKRDTVEQFMDSLQQYSSLPDGLNQKVSSEFGVDLCNAFISYNDKDYSKAAELLLPHEYQLVNLGGSEAQRDLVHQFLIHSAFKSTNPSHQKYARQLLAKRKAKKENSPLTDRLSTKYIIEHCF